MSDPVSPSPTPPPASRPAFPGCSRPPTRPRSRSRRWTTGSRSWSKLGQAQSQLTDIDAQLGQIRLQLAQSQNELAQQQAVLGSHLAWMYKLGDYGLLDELLNGGSLTDAAARIEFLKRLNQQDRQLRDGFLATVGRINALQTSIAAKRDQAMVVQQQVDADTAPRSKASWPSVRRSSTASTAVSRRSSTSAPGSPRSPPAARRAALAHIGAIRGTPAQIGVVRAALGSSVCRTSGAAPAPSGFDCSGLVLYVYARYGVALPHFAAYQAEMGVPVAESQLEPADLVFFGAPIHHVVIYIANGLIVEAPHTGDVVKVARLSDFEAPTACRRYALRLP